jgi:hypothetical protein
MAGRECYHCKQWVEPGEAHDCWTTTEAALTRDLSDDLQEAWERLREAAAAHGDQRIYASHHSIMFSRKVCYVFVRPKAKYLEVCIFLPCVLKSSRIRKVYSSSTKHAHMLRIVHRDEVEPPFTDWLREAYDCADPKRASTTAPRVKSKPRARRSPKGTSKAPERSRKEKPRPVARKPIKVRPRGAR